MKKRLITVGVVIGFCLAVVVTRAVWQGRSALDDGDRALEAGDAEEAIRGWRRAARWYLPLAPHVTDAYERLEDLAGLAEARGDLATAIAAWQGVRGSILATRSFYTPHSERLDPANRHIADLMARVDREPPPDMTPETLEAWHYELLARRIPVGRLDAPGAPRLPGLDRRRPALRRPRGQRRGPPGPPAGHHRGADGRPGPVRLAARPLQRVD
jgi:hypothetical protein